MERFIKSDLQSAKIILSCNEVSFTTSKALRDRLFVNENIDIVSRKNVVYLVKK